VRAGRLISLVSILSREGRTTAASLAERLEVSERTILRDLEVLSGSGPRPASPRAATQRMMVLVTEEGRRTAAILGHLQPLRVRAEPAPRDGWVTAICRLRSHEAMAVEVLALGPHVEVVAPDDLRARR
jgi:predicted DNA-binding transcriptional regulator YafY